MVRDSYEDGLKIRRKMLGDAVREGEVRVCQRRAAFGREVQYDKFE
jgi:hypothetical protein